MKRSAVVSTVLLLAACVGVTINAAMGDTEKSEVQAVERAVLDYCEAFYDVKPKLVERSVHRDLNKFGFWRLNKGDDYRRIPMNYEQLVGLANVWNANGDKVTADTPKKVEVFDVLDKTASAKLTAQWGIDYMLLVKYEGKWMIERVVWQSHPK
ncbi:MAG: hypothetical protein DHS20C16_29990 [Phycisphaerae bacterium]|nr:MAG: hypothetical protein DHS20C16_29990 [Phycisphaerae bacterium]